jgi:hypothetical protein
VVRGVWVTISVQVAAIASYGLAVCAGGEESLGQFSGGHSLVQSDVVFAGSVRANRFGFRFSGTTFVPVVMEVPVHLPFLGGPQWVLVEVGSNQITDFNAGLRIEPERLVAPALERGRAARLGRDNGRVMQELREAAEVASG